MITGQVQGFENSCSYTSVFEAELIGPVYNEVGNPTQREQGQWIQVLFNLSDE
jgi:hypothetical protein